MTFGTLLLGSALLLLAAGLLTSCLRLRGVTEFVLAFYCIGFGLVVAVELLLSPSRDLTSTWLSGVLAVVAAVSAGLWIALGRPQPPSFRPALLSAREALRDPVVAVLAVAVLGAFGYVAALIIGTAPNDYDVLWYHLARAAFWKQQHAVAYIAGANDARLNGFPPNAEIAQSFTMILGRTDRFAGFVQFTALLATMASIFGIGRRLGLSVRQGLFAGLLFATLPVVILQSSTSLNDLVFGSFLAVCAYFLFTWRPVSLGLAALALGLALGTKLTAVLGLPMLALLGAFLYPRRRWGRLVLVGLAGVVIGSPWYVLNIAKTSRLNGGLANAQNATTVSHGNTNSVAGVIGHFLRLLIDAFDPSGAVGRDRLVYLVAAGAILVLGLRVRRGPRAAEVVMAAALAACPLAFRVVDHGFLHAYQKLFVALDRRNVAFLGFDKHLTVASPFQSWYGPLGFLLALAGFGLAWVAVRRRGMPRVVWFLAAAPIAWLVLQAATTFYSLFDGRYVMFGVALGAVLWGLALEIRPLAWAATGIAVVAVALALVHYDEKPSGVNILGGSAPTSVWDKSRAEVLSRWLHPGETEVVATLEREAKKGDTIALAIHREDVSYPYFGENLDRKVVFVVPPHLGPAWMVAAPGLEAPRLSEPVTLSYHELVNSHGWRLYRLG